MGYDVHITRKQHWADETGPRIELDEWLRYVEGDAEMRLDGAAEAGLADGGTLRVEGPGIAVWVAYSGHGRDGNMAWFDHFEDRVTVKNPDREILRKMFAIAQALDARVQGDEGEGYDADGEAVWDEPIQDVDLDAADAQRPWWRFWD
mgnify:CR=1 FL=1